MSRQIIIFHEGLENFGGTAIFVKYLVRALYQLNYSPIIVSCGSERSFKSFSPNTFIGQTINIKTPCIGRMVRGKIPLYGNLLKRTLDITLLNKTVRLFKREKMLTFNIHGERLFLPTQLIYIHDPELLSKINYNRNNITKYITKFSYYGIWSKILKAYRGSKILVNSSFSLKLLKYHTGFNGEVLYPPISIGKFDKAFRGPHDKPWIVTISRFNKYKNLEIILEIAKNLKDNILFLLIGGITLKDEINYYIYLRKKCKKYDLRNIVFLPNIPEKYKIKILSRAKIYLHPTKKEHFGISIIEAMASGLIPIVHKSGGPWEDILEKKQGLYGYTYENVEEATSLILYVLNQGFKEDEMIKIRKRAYKFDYRYFKSNLESILKCLC